MQETKCQVLLTKIQNEHIIGTICYNKNTNYDVSLYNKTTENLFRMGGIEPEIIDSNFLVPFIC